MVQTRRQRRGQSNDAGVNEQASASVAASIDCVDTDDVVAATDKGSPSQDVVVNDDVTKLKTPKNCAQQWKDLFKMRDNRKSIFGSSSTIESNDNYDAQDVFDCSDLIVPPAHELVNQEVERGIERWKDLASRVILDEGGSVDVASVVKTEKGDADVQLEGAPLQNHELLLDATIGGDKRKQRLMPFNFDYGCKRKPSDRPATDDDDDGGRRRRARVISLRDPTQTLDYEEELWHVFKSVKTADELERMHALGNPGDGAKQGGSIDDSSGVVAHGCNHTLAVKNNLKEWISQYSRIDAHSLGRLRIRERHPNSSVVPSRSSNGNGMMDTTIRFEILRHSQNLERGSGRDSNRMEVELYGSHHTLFDLHRMLVECSLSTDSNMTRCDASSNNNNIRPGVFFIENTFYTCGDAGDSAVETIKRWLDGKEYYGPPQISDDTENVDELEKGLLPPVEYTDTSRREFLGLSLCNNTIPMSQMKLEDVPLRLGVRYFHMFVPPSTPLQLRPNNMWSLANESAVFVTGIYTHSNASGSNTRHGGHRSTDAKTPITLLDMWGSAHRQQHTCFGCNHSFASVVTVNDPLTDAAPPSLDSETNTVHLQGVPMCSSCYQSLHYKPISGHGKGAKSGNHSLLELRSGSDHQPGLVFSVEEYQRMVTASRLDEIPKKAPF